MATLSREHYICSGVIVWCFDARFAPALDEMKQRTGDKCDIVSIAGGAKDLAEPERREHRDYILRQIGLSIRLHSAKKVILMTHSDCGAFGGLQAFENSKEKEYAAHKKTLTSARTIVETRFPEVKVETFFCNFRSCLPL